MIIAYNKLSRGKLSWLAIYKVKPLFIGKSFWLAHSWIIYDWPCQSKIENFNACIYDKTFSDGYKHYKKHKNFPLNVCNITDPKVAQPHQ